MSEAEQAEATWRIAMAMPDVAALIAKDARENLGGVDVVSVGSVFAREIQDVQCHAVVAIVVDRDGKDFVPNQVILDVTQNYTVACLNRMTLISCLEDHFARVQVFGTDAVPAKSFEDAVKEFAKRGYHVTQSSIEMWFGDRWCKEAELV